MRNNIAIADEHFDENSSEGLYGKVKKKRSKKKIILTVVVVLLVLTIIAAQIVTHVLMRENFCRGEYPEYSTGYRYDRYEKDYPRKNVSFKSGENTLQGYIYGEENDKGLIVFVHGIGGGHEGYMNEIIWFVDHGWRVFSYDATGSCTSEGDGTKGLPQSALDLDKALTYIENDKELSKLPKFLAGHSWGGYAVTAVLNFGHDVKASASISGYAYPMEMVEEFADGFIGKASVLIRPCMWADCFASFGRNVNLSAIDGINKSDTPVLIIHGKEDKMISFDGASIISKKNEIKNPNAEYYPIDGKYSGHNLIFYSQEANEYMEELDKQYDKISAKYKEGKVPDKAEKEFFDKIDKEKANEENEVMLNKINNFFEDKL